MGGSKGPDASLQSQQQIALNQLITQDQRLTQSDMSSLMAQYGTRLAGSPLIAAAALPGVASPAGTLSPAVSLARAAGGR